MNMKKALIVLIIGVLLGVLFINKSFLLMIFSLVLIYAIAATGLNIVSGFTGQVSIGHGAFMAVGAYTTAAMAMDFGTPFYINILAAIVLAAFLGFLIGLPALRLKGFYLAIATMAFGVAVEQLFAAIEHFGGHIGMRNIPRFFESDFYIYLLNLVFFVVLTYVASLILHSPVGEKYKMVRDSEVAARAYGIKPSRIKLNAFIVSAIYGGIAGALYSHTVGYISPPDFGMNTSLNLLSMIVIGGMASLEGGMIGSIIITGLPFLFSRGNIPMTLIFGALLIVFVLFFPQGIAYGLKLLSMKYLGRPWALLVRKSWSRRAEDGKYVTVNGKKIFYRQQGNGPAIVMIHGNFGSHRWYEKVSSIEGYTTYIPDLVNFGKSDRIDNVSIDTYADFVKGFMDQLKIEKAVVVGHSLGGAVSMSLAFRYPQLVSKLVLVDSAPVNGLVTPEENFPVLEMMKGNVSLLRNSLKGIMPACEDQKILSEVVKDALLMKDECFSENARALSRYDYTELAERYKNPVLFILGKKDLLITQDMAENTLKNLNGRLEVLDHVGHSVILEDSQLFKKLLINFVNL